MKIYILSIFLLISFNSYSQFRNTTWGMNKQQVKKIEASKLTSDYGNTLDYSLEVEDLHCRLQYHFNTKDTLISITYTFSTSSSSTTKSQIYTRTINNITAKYGEPNIKEQSYFTWNTKDYSINAIKERSSYVKVTYSPPAPSLKDIL